MRSTTICVLLSFAALSSPAASLRALIIDGQNNHEWQRTTPVLKKLLEDTGMFQVDVATTPPKGGDFSAFHPDFSKYQLVISNYNTYPNGDSWPDAVQTAFEPSGRQALMTVFHNQGHWDTSNVEYVSERIVAYDKRNPTPRMRHIDYGLGVLRRTAFDRCRAETFDLVDLYQALVANDDLAGFEVSERFYEIGSPAGLAETRTHLEEKTKAYR